jgi:hypothetical protein
MSVRVQTTEDFLQGKLFRLRQRLWEDYEADAKQLDLIIGYLTADTDKGLTGYASQLHRELSTLGDRAAQLVAYVQVPAPNRPKAEKLVRQYLAMFASVVTPGDSS